MHRTRNYEPFTLLERSPRVGGEVLKELVYDIVLKDRPNFQGLKMPRRPSKMPITNV